MPAPPFKSRVKSPQPPPTKGRGPISLRRPAAAHLLDCFGHENTSDNRETRSSKTIIGNAAAFRITTSYLWSRNTGLLLGRYLRSGRYRLTFKVRAQPGRLNVSRYRPDLDRK